MSAVKMEKLLLILQQLYHKTEYVDKSPQMIDYATDKYPTAAMTDKILNREVLDVLFSNAILHWVDNHQAFLQGANCVLRPGGRLIISCGGEGNAADILQVFAELVVREPLDRALGGFLLSTVGFGSFKIVHLRIHHRYVGTPLDFATAQRGQSIYAFWWKNLISNVSEAIRCEREELARRGQAFWHSELLLWYLLSLLWLAIDMVLGGWKGGVFWGIQALIAILTLDWTNYLQHYGLTRKQDARGRYEPVQVHHAWSSGIFLRDLALFNLMRHGDHHANPQRHYQSLRHDDNVPEYPYNYSIMYLLALVPPLFQRIVHPYLDRFESQQQQPQEG